LEVGSFVESAVKGDGKRASEFDELAGSFEVNGVVGVEDAEDEAVHLARFGESDGGAHLVEFRFGVSEVAGARANHGEDGKFDGGASFAHELFGGSKAADGEVGAEFNAMGAAAFGGNGGGKGFDGDFEEWGHEMDSFVSDADEIEERFLSPQTDRFAGSESERQRRRPAPFGMTVW
jgi:hypothetical protein